MPESGNALRRYAHTYHQSVLENLANPEFCWLLHPLSTLLCFGHYRVSRQSKGSVNLPAEPQSYRLGKNPNAWFQPLSYQYPKWSWQDWQALS
ncbi:Uncharacterised protein [Vibrio cholerae]|nr:Uncharacterised protein [Vibrio cholerae]